MEQNFEITGLAEIQNWEERAWQASWNVKALAQVTQTIHKLKAQSALARA
jgi:hypothetical protein